MSKIERARVWTPDERETRLVALKQPHRRESDNPDNPMRGFALGRFCLRYWTDEGTQRDYCDVGERYAQLMDVYRLDRGEPARQSAEMKLYPAAKTFEEQMERRARSESALKEADCAIREVHPSAVKIVQTLAYDDFDLAAYQEGRAYHGLYKLRVHFEVVDNPKR